MLKIIIPATELFNEETNEFIRVKGYELSLEHSLLSISKWEAKWHKPFLTDDRKTEAEALDYVKCMTLTKNIPDEAYLAIPQAEMEKIAEYINNPMTATTFSDRGTPPSRQILTSELIYYNMTAAGIPFECQKWHLNRLLVLLKICGIKSQPSKKMSPQKIRSQNSAINAARRARLGSKG